MHERLLVCPPTIKSNAAFLDVMMKLEFSLYMPKLLSWFSSKHKMLGKGKYMHSKVSSGAGLLDY